MAAIGSAMPEFALILLIADATRPSPAILQLDLVPGIKESARSKFNQQIGSLALRGREENTEATRSAIASQDRSHVGSRSDPLFGGKEFSQVAAKPIRLGNLQLLSTGDFAGIESAFFSMHLTMET